MGRAKKAHQKQWYSYYSRPYGGYDLFHLDSPQSPAFFLTVGHSANVGNYSLALYTTYLVCTLTHTYLLGIGEFQQLFVLLLIARISCLYYAPYPALGFFLYFG